MPAANFRITEGYDVPRITKVLDLINVMTYDMRGAWDNKADHHAPMNVRYTRLKQLIGTPSKEAHL